MAIGQQLKGSSREAASTLRAKRARFQGDVDQRRNRAQSGAGLVMPFPKC